MMLALGQVACRPAGRIVTVGDSLTADPLSWARILAAAFELACGASSPRVVNLGVGGDTTVHIVSRFEQVMREQPELVIVLAGTNDARVHGAPDGRVLVADADTRRNLELLCRLTRDETRAAIALITPPPVLDERIRMAPRLMAERVSWTSDAVDRKAAIVQSLSEHVIDSRVALPPPLGRFLRADGLHLTLAGQERLAGAVVSALAGGHRSTG
jgi:lysophospholipase L1-like esterase